MITTDVRILSDEVILRLDKLPRKIREQVAEKFSAIFSQAASELTSQPPGKFLDPKYIKTGVEQIGSSVIGFLEVEDKPGFYSIYPSKARVLRFVAKSGEVVFARKVDHPYLKGAPVVERYLLESKPWVLEQLDEAVEEAIR